jgi:hypothetical protein
MKTNIGLSKKVWMRFKHRFRQEIFSIYRSVAFVSKTFSALFCLRKKMFVLFFFTRERERKKVCNKHLDARLGCVQSVGLTSASTRPRFVFVLWLLTLLTFRLVRLAQDRKIVRSILHQLIKGRIDLSGCLLGSNIFFMASKTPSEGFQRIQHWNTEFIFILIIYKNKT